ncbi:Omp28-related outer membrane protein [Kordia algicida OT-1]|uniref:LigB lipoprotein n=1 Tax=Kordia algicida OT-1 TaxID=391587 RepID=A9E237_9FLAO|nr:Omp28-related outer membrane protein [Kordia algicida]EDP95523.1 LigB lipoprotein [Kordia algicida OT-1]
MKTKNIFKCLLAVAALFVYSCSSDSDGDGGTTTPPGGGGTSGITSITVNASDSSIELGGSITFTVTANDGSNVTANSTILVNNSAITGVEYTPTATGSFQITAKYETLTSGAINVEVTPPVITALRVESADTSIKVGDTAEFIVIGTDAGGNDYTITSEATISVNGTEIVGNRFMATEIADIEASATKDGITSAVFNLPVTDDTAPGTFAKNAIIEDYTGTWCGWCPRVSYAIEQVEAQSDRVFAIAAHSGDAMENSYSAALDNVYVTSGYPTAVLNRDVDWTYPEPSNVAQATNLASGTTTSGLSLNSMVVGNNLRVYVSAAFAQSTPGAKLVVLVLEDGIVASQRNYTSYYGGADPISQFVHNHTLRHSITDVFGDAIPAGSTGAGQRHKEVFDIPVPALVNDRSKMSIVAMIVGSDNKVINATGAHVGTDKDYQAN